MKIYVNLLYYPVLSLGPGIRAGLWLQGCSIKCKNCISKHTWQISPQYQTSIQNLAQKINSIPTEKLTISGGEPLDQSVPLLNLLKLIRKTKKDILLYTGYTLQNFIKNNPKIWKEIRQLVDVIIDGPFIWGQETSSIWKGSENQKMYILNPKLKEYYLHYQKQTKNNKLQLIEHNQNLFLIGIPHQKDYTKLIQINQNLNPKFKEYLE